MSRKNDTKSLNMSFYGNNWVEAEGVFHTETMVGAFGAKLDRARFQEQGCSRAFAVQSNFRFRRRLQTRSPANLAVPELVGKFPETITARPSGLLRRKAKRSRVIESDLVQGTCYP